MMAYALAAMSLSDWWRRIFSSPGETAEEEAAFRTEYGGVDEGKADLDKLARSGGMLPGIAGIEAAGAAKAAEAELEELEPPPDPAP